MEREREREMEVSRAIKEHFILDLLVHYHTDQFCSDTNCWKIGKNSDKSRKKTHLVFKDWLLCTRDARWRKGGVRTKNLKSEDYLTWVMCFRLQPQQPQKVNEEGTRPVLRIYSACCSVFAARLFLLASAAARFSSALCLVAANLFISLSWACPLILSTSTWMQKSQD